MSNETTTWDGEGYGADAPSGGGGGIFRLKEKGQEAVMRIGTGPWRYTDTLPSGKDKGKKVPKASWGVILRENSGPRAVVFDAGAMVYGLIKQLAEDPQFGDPTTYDIVVTRTESDSNYYTVSALQKDKGLSNEDVGMLANAGILTAGAVGVVIASSKKPSQSAPDHGDEDDPFLGK